MKTGTVIVVAGLLASMIPPPLAGQDETQAVVAAVLEKVETDEVPTGRLGITGRCVTELPQEACGDLTPAAMAALIAASPRRVQLESFVSGRVCTGPRRCRLLDPAGNDLAGILTMWDFRSDSNDTYTVHIGVTKLLWLEPWSRGFRVILKRQGSKWVVDEFVQTSTT